MTSRLTLLTIFLFTFTFQLVNAQDLDTVTIAGRVTDQNGAVIPGAEVQATLIKTGFTRRTTSNAQGRYRLVQLEPGSYVLRMSANGFAAQQIENVATVSGQTLEFEVTLLPADLVIEPVVITSAEPPLVDTKRTVVGATLTAAETRSLPLNTRSPLDLIFLLPGVTEEPLSTRDLAEDRNGNAANTPEEAGIFALAGAPAYSNNLTIDGLDNNDDRAARERFQPSLEAIAEVQVITNQFSAEYGRASGGRVNLRTRSGSRQFHGSGFYFFRDEALNANSFRNNSLGLARLPLQDHVVGFTLGGPLLPLRKRAVFFVSYELNKTLDSALIDTLVPVQQNDLYRLPRPTLLDQRRLEDVDPPELAAEVAPFISSLSTPFRNTSVTARVDHQFSETHNASIVYQAGRLVNLRQFGGGNRLAEALQARRRNSDAISYSDNFVFSSRVVNQLRLQYSRLAPSFATSSGDKPVVLITLNDSHVDEDPARRSGTLIAGSSTLGGSDRREERAQLQQILSLIRRDHSLKFGVDIQHVRSTFIDLTDLSGTFSFASAGDFLAGVPSRYRQNFQSSSTQRNTYAGFFVQDEWQLHPRVLVSYGLRYERETILRDVNNVGPRFSVAYAPTEKVVVRAGGGIFYNRPLLRTIDDFTLGHHQLFFDTNALRDPLNGKLLTAEQRRAFIAAHLRFPQTLDSDSTLVREFGVLNTDFARRLDPALRIPESYQLNAGIERDLGRGYAVEANFTFTRGIHLWREFNANAPVLPAGYSNFTEFLASRDFANFVNPLTGVRPLHNASNAGELVRFAHASLNPTNPNAITRVVEFGVPVSVMNLTGTSSTTLNAALAALNQLRPDPTRGELEQLVSVGNSFYRAMSVELRKRFYSHFTFRTGYTMSSLVDDGVVNTSDALVPGDFRGERARSLLDRRHRFVFSGTFNLPRYVGGLTLSPIWRVASEAPFNISIGGVDRNLDDVSNDRPNYSGDLRLLRWRRPGEPLDPTVLAGFSLPPIGQSGNLSRNAGRGPGLFVFDLNVTREFQVSRFKICASVAFDNVLNKTVFSFGSEFINFASGSNDSFLLATRTGRPRQVRLGLRAEF
ncbi:MAG: TonB-dependent receptor [Acidobacteria bacterium]|nr:TonB-dependent receptor [Acidobacteriota bacterium]MCA1627575.1 TonB-dependent receptor [Acidobacteriota bacterium]